MGLFEKIFGKTNNAAGVGDSFKTFTAYTPAFRKWMDSSYSSELVRSAINARATHISKLKVETCGTANPKLQAVLRKSPNTWQTWSQFLYRLSTILDMQNTAFIVPVVGSYGYTVGVFPVLPSQCEIVEYAGTQWLRYTFSTGTKAAVELSKCGIMTKFQYKDDFFGEDNQALNQTLNLISIQNQGIEEATKNAATFRFMAKLTNFAKPDDLRKEQKRFTEENLRNDAGGVLLFPNTYSEIKQISSTPYLIDAKQREVIQTSIYNYFGVNEDVLQNKAYGDAWSAFYEGAVEAFAIQFSEVMTKMLFTEREIASGTHIMATSNRLQYMSNKDKLDVSAQMADRGILSINEIREIWNLPPVDGGDNRIIRGEYYDASEKTKGGEADDREVTEQDQ